MWRMGRFRRFASLSTRTNSHGSEEKQRTTLMEKEAAFPNDFPTDGVELRCFLMVSDYARSLAFYRDAPRATVIRELYGIQCFLIFAGSQILLSAQSGSMQATPAVLDPPPLDCTCGLS